MKPTASTIGVCLAALLTAVVVGILVIVGLGISSGTLSGDLIHINAAIVFIALFTAVMMSSFRVYIVITAVIAFTALVWLIFAGAIFVLYRAETYGAFNAEHLGYSRALSARAIEVIFAFVVMGVVYEGIRLIVNVIRYAKGAGIVSTKRSLD